MAIPAGYTILKLPQWVLFIRIAQGAVALVAFGLLCYGESVFSFDGDGLMLFTSLATFIVLAYILASEFFFQQLYNFWAVLALECFLVLFWLVSFALLASEVSGVGFGGYPYICFYNCLKRSLSKRSDPFYGTMATAAALGGVEFALFVVTLVVVSIFVHRERIGTTPTEAATKVETTQATPQSPAHPRDLEQEMIENESRLHTAQQVQTPTQAEGPETSHVEHVEQGAGAGGERIYRGEGAHFHIEV